MPGERPGRRFDRWGAISLALWLAGVIGYFGPWVTRRPYSAALSWNAYDLFDLLRLLPEIESGGVMVNLQAFRLPLLSLAVLLPLLLAPARRLARWIAAAIGALFALMTLPPYPQIVTAWRTPGWRVPFWWGVGALIAVIAAAAWAHHLRRFRVWVAVGCVALALLPAAATLARLMPALRTLHAAPVYRGWGFWLHFAGMIALALVCWAPLWPKALRAFPPPVAGVAGPDRLARVRDVKRRYESDLMKKAHVVGVGIGLPSGQDPSETEPGLIVNVTEKVDLESLAPEDRMPRSLDGVRVWVRTVGDIRKEE